MARESDNGINVSLQPVGEGNPGIRYDVPGGVSVEVFSDRVHAGNSRFSVQVQGRPSDQTIDRQGLTIQTEQAEGVPYQIQVRPGQVIVSFAVESDISPRRKVERNRVMAERESLFAQASVDDPTTFNDFSLADTLSYFRREAGISQEQLVERLDNPSFNRGKIGKLEGSHSKTVPPRTFIDDLINVYGWDQDNPRRDILIGKHQQAEREALARRRRYK